MRIKTAYLVIILFLSAAFVVGCSDTREINPKTTNAPPESGAKAAEHSPTADAPVEPKKEPASAAKVKEKSSDSPKEEVVFSFKTKADEKVLSICASRKEDYIVYRFGKKDGSIELEYPDTRKDSWSRFTFSDYHRGGGSQNEAVDFSYLSFTNGDYTYTVYDEYTANGERSVGVRVVNKSTNIAFDIEGISQGAAGGLLFLMEKYPKLGRPTEGLDSISGIWFSTDYDENHGTDVSILPTSDHEFDMEVHAFKLISEGNPHIGEMRGKGKVNGNKIEFSLEDGDVKGEIRVADDRLLITYTGDTSKYAGLNVIFGTEFKRSDKT